MAHLQRSARGLPTLQVLVDSSLTSCGAFVPLYSTSLTSCSAGILLFFIARKVGDADLLLGVQVLLIIRHISLQNRDLSLLAATSRFVSTKSRFRASTSEGSVRSGSICRSSAAICALIRRRGARVSLTRAVLLTLKDRVLPVRKSVVSSVL
jgi:hypothetical protein